MDEIKLRKVGEPEFNTLPRGVYAIVLAEKVVFVKRVAGRFIPLLEREQEELRDKHVVKWSSPK
jgi:hypothetical protein